MIGVQILYKSVVLSVWACLWHTTSLSQWTQLRNEFVLWWFYRHAFFQVRWGSGSIVSVRWVHLDNPRLWECGNEWECNTQTASTLPHQSDYKIHFYDLMWPSLILHCSSTLLAFILVHNDLSIRSDSAGLWRKFLKVSYQAALKYPHLPFHPYLNTIIPTKTFCLSSLKLLFTHVLWHRT